MSSIRPRTSDAKRFAAQYSIRLHPHAELCFVCACLCQLSPCSINASFNIPWFCIANVTINGPPGRMHFASATIFSDSSYSAQSYGMIRFGLTFTFTSTSPLSHIGASRVRLIVFKDLILSAHIRGVSVAVLVSIMARSSSPSKKAPVPDIAAGHHNSAARANNSCTKTPAARPTAPFVRQGTQTHSSTGRASGEHW